MVPVTNAVKEQEVVVNLPDGQAKRENETSNSISKEKVFT
jgi:hypothetical protein